MNISQKGIDLIQRWEQCRLEPYQDSKGVWTIGYGHTRTASEFMLPISQKTADVLFAQDITIFEYELKQLLKIDLKQCQYDAIVSLVFNIGIGNFSRSKTWQLIKNNPKDILISDEWIEFRKSGGKPLRGLLRRRIDELSLYYSW